jgi:hypothetical protein
VTENRGRPISRRGLFGIFGRGAKGFREAIEKSAPALTPGAARAPAPSFERKLRPPDETVAAASDGQGGFLVDLRRRPLAIGRSLRIAGPGLAEPLLAVRVNEHHVGIVGGECATDGSDLLWLQFEDRVACPSCGSRWRLDGSHLRGPADSPLALFLVDETAGLLHFRGIGR